MKDHKCKDCAHGLFPTDAETGARSWTGRCIAKLINQSDEAIKAKNLKAQTIMQHFKCSNGLYKAR